MSSSLYYISSYLTAPPPPSTMSWTSSLVTVSVLSLLQQLNNDFIFCQLCLCWDLKFGEMQLFLFDENKKSRNHPLWQHSWKNIQKRLGTMFNWSENGFSSKKKKWFLPMEVGGRILSLKINYWKFVTFTKI